MNVRTAGINRVIEAVNELCTREGLSNGEALVALTHMLCCVLQRAPDRPTLMRALIGIVESLATGSTRPLETALLRDMPPGSATRH